MKNSVDVIAELEERVKRRRELGDYPVGLEAQLEADFIAIMDVVHRSNDRLPLLRHKIEESRHRMTVTNALIDPRSRLPGGALAHRIIGRLVGRQTRGLAAQIREAQQSVVDALSEIYTQLEQQRSDDARMLNQVGHLVMDRLVMIDVLAEAVTELERKARAGRE